MDIEKEIFDAFQVEHREQLQRIRSLLVDMQRVSGSARGACLDEAFRMAHSLKGGARVCDLQPAERLGHGLETVFANVREGALILNEDAVRTVNIVLDAIEDWMDAILKTESPPEPTEAFAAIERLIHAREPVAAASVSPATDSLEQQLRSTFLGEYPAYVHGLRNLLSDRGPRAAVHPAEAFRLAHNLRASAHAAGEVEVARLAQPLEALFRRWSHDAEAWSDADCRQADAMLTTVEDRILRGSAATSSIAVTSPDASEAVFRTAQRSARPATSSRRSTSAVATGEPVLDTVRVRADSLDRLLQSSGQLSIQGVQQDQVTRDLLELRGVVDSVQRERDALRRAIAAAQQRLGEVPELRRVARCVNKIDAHVQSLSQNVRQLCLRQQRNVWTLHSHTTRIQSDIRQARMVSAQSLLNAFSKMVRDLARDQGKQAEIKIAGADVRADRAVLQSLKDPLMHILRNAVTHGIEAPEQRVLQNKPACGTIELDIKATGNHLQITIQDDGQGIDFAQVAKVAANHPASGTRDGTKLGEEELQRLIFEPGFSTCATVSDLAGRGMGLNVVQEAVRRLQGTVQLLDRKDAGTCICLTVPLMVCAQRMLLLASGGQTYAVPLHAVQRLSRVNATDIESLEGRSMIPHQRRLIPIVSMSEALGLGGECSIPRGQILPTVILASAARRVALTVDAFLGEQDAVMQELDAVAARKEISGAISAADGTPVLVLEPSHLLGSPSRCTGAMAALRPRTTTSRPRILVVDDSFTTRTLEKSILETNGYEVHVATDGLEALEQLRSRTFAAVISDIEMPRLDGFGLLEQMKSHSSTAEIPVILVTSRDQAEDQQRGMALGADAYIIKRKFDHQDLLSAVEQMIVPSNHG